MITVGSAEISSTPIHRDSDRLTYVSEDEDKPLIIGPMTDRSGDELAERYGYTDLERLSTSLPSDSEILDVGAGLSNLGHMIASRRPDIQWTNLDIRYSPGRIHPITETTLENLKFTAPDNVRYVAGNVLELPREIAAKRYAHIFSYYMIHHVSNNGREFGVQAIRNMLQLGEPGGKLSVGPVNFSLYSTHTVIIPETPEAVEALAAQVTGRLIE